MAEGLVAFAETVDPTQMIRGVYHDEPYELPIMIPLVQAISHATEHRCQVATVLSQLGIEPPDLSAWAYDEAMRG